MAKKSKATAVVAKKTTPSPPSFTGLSSAYVWTIALITGVITFLVFSPSIHDQFVNWDDPEYVLGNPLVLSEHIAWKAIFTTPVSLNYHPLTMLSLALNFQAGKLDPMGYHLVNVLLHVANTILTYFFVFLLTRRNALMASVVALFFGIHPMHVESVSWVSERKDVLYVFFFLAGLITYLQYEKGKKIVWYILTLLLFVLSCLSKGMAVVFPVVLLLIDYYNGVKWNWKLLVEKAPFFIIALGFGIAAYTIQQGGGSMSGMQTYSFLRRVSFASVGALRYISDLVLPVNVSVFYPYPPLNEVPVTFYLAPFVILAIGILIWRLALRRQKEIVFGVLFYFTTVALVLQFISVGSALHADRYSYLCYIGLLFVVAHALNMAWQEKQNWAWLKWPLTLAVAIAAVAFSFETYARTQVWKSGLALWDDAIEKYPDAAPAYYHRGVIYQDSLKTDLALKDYNIGIAFNYKVPAIFDNRGRILAEHGQVDSAVADFKRALAVDSNFPGAWLNLAIYHSMKKQFDTALIEYGKALKGDPGLQKAYFNRAVAYMNMGEYAKADSDLAKAISLNPEDAEGYINRAAYFNVRNEPAKALEDCNKAIQFDPNAKNYNLRGETLKKLNKYNESLADFNKAIQLDQMNPVYWFNKSVSERALGMKKEALSDAYEAIKRGGKLEEGYLESLN